MADVLVSTEWALQHLKDADKRFVEVDVDTTQYETGHLDGAIAFNWQSQLQDRVARDIISKDDFEKLVSEAGITPQTTVVLYGAGILNPPDILRTPSLIFRVRALVMSQEDGEVVIQRLSERAHSGAGLTNWT